MHYKYTQVYLNLHISMTFMCYIALGLCYYLRLTYYHEAGKQDVNRDCKSLNPSSEDKFL